MKKLFYLIASKGGMRSKLKFRTLSKKCNKIIIHLLKHSKWQNFIRSKYILKFDKFCVPYATVIWEDIQKYKNLKYLKTVDIQQKGLKNLSLIPKCVEEISISRNNLVDLNFMVDIKNLVHLDIRYNDIRKISYLLPTLLSLHAEGNPLEEICHLPKGLTTLNIINTKLHFIKFVNTITTLSIDNQIKNIKWPSSLKFLSYFYKNFGYVEKIPDDLPLGVIYYNSINIKWDSNQSKFLIMG